MTCPTRIFVVSLAKSRRRAGFAERARDAGLDWSFFDACEGLDADLAYDEAEAKLRYGRTLKGSELGCYSSHYRLWKQLLADDADQYIVLEDDVIVDWSMVRIVARTDFAASGVRYLRLYFKSPGPFFVRKRRYLTRSSHLIELKAVAYGTQGYVITRAAAERLVPHCRRVTRPIDDQLDRFWEHGLPNLCLFPFPLVEEAGASTIGDDRFTKTRLSFRQKLYVLRDLAMRRAAVMRRARHRQDWTAIPYRDEPSQKA